MKKHISIFILFLPMTLIAQSTYFNIYDDGTNKAAGDILVLESGNTLLPVLSRNDTSWFPELYKFNADGNVIDKVEFPNNSDEYTNIQKLHLCDDGTLLAFGDYWTGVDIYDLWVLELDTSLNVIDEHLYHTGLSHIAIFNSITDSYGNVILFCNTMDPINLWKNFIFRLNQDGDSLFAKIYDTPGLHFASDILETQNSNGYYLFSIWPGLNYNEGKTSIVEVDYNFEVLKILGTTHNTRNASVEWFNDTSFIASGHRNFSTSPLSTDYIEKIGVSIIGLSDTVINEYYWGQPDTIIQPTAYNNLGFHNSDIYYSGVLNFHLPYTTDVSWIVLIKLDSNLNPLWQKFIGGDKFYQVFSMYVIEDGSCLLTGFAIDFLNGNDDLDLYLAKIGPNGEFLSSPETPQSLMEVKLYPNPGSDYFMLDVRLPEQKNRIELFDLNGKCCLQKDIQNGSNTINTSKLPSGVYVFKIISNTKEVLSGKWVKN
ncbi:MAG: T9SS type A sorting domain-containing protein [Bacteroidales bacterium]|nr:T9SS type A sorting domain-containing protein [Bacteroidales bacterium]MCF8456746.1 T9SS type A sorting domain-containing protein [Bacteroidales bacterium]